MNFTEAIATISGFRYVSEQLEICSAPGRKMLQQLQFLTGPVEIEQQLTHVEEMVDKLTDKLLTVKLSLLKAKLSHLRNIETTIKRIGSGMVVDDVELFEIKHFAILVEDIAELTEQLALSFIQLPETAEVIDILDPEKKRVPHFYIYDMYSEELADLRNKIANSDIDKEEEERLREKAQLLEDDIRRQLVSQLSPYADILHRAYTQLAYLDLVRGKALLAIGLVLVKPSIAKDKTRLNGLFHPEIKSSLEANGKQFQPVNISFSAEPTVITGANMAGKSVLLKSIALTQVMMQFGFFVPAAKADIIPVEEVVSCIGDEEDNLKGLSSFAGEILRLNGMLEKVLDNRKLLVLIDEPARTTNPIEGSAIACGWIDFLKEHKVLSLITTHYTIYTNCRRLRIKGFTAAPGEVVNTDTINDYMDYSPEEVTENEVPHEAIRIAEIIGVNREMIDRFNNYIDRNSQ